MVKPNHAEAKVLRIQARDKRNYSSRPLIGSKKIPKFSISGNWF